MQLLTVGFGIDGGQTKVGGIVGLSSDGKSLYMPTWTNKTAYSLRQTSLDKAKVKRFNRGCIDVIDYVVNDGDQILARELYDNEENSHRVEAKSMADGIRFLEKKQRCALSRWSD